MFGKFSLDALASCAFGVDAQSFSDSESHPFIYHAQELFKNDAISGILRAIRFIPGVSQILQQFNINIQHPKSVKFFRDIILHTINARKGSKEKRNDLIDLILDCMKDENANEEEEDSNNDPHDQYHR